MKSAPLPAFPILFCLIGAGLLVASALIWAGPSGTQSKMALPVFEPASQQAAIEPVQYHNPSIASGSANRILQASPFVMDRTAFSRTARPVPKAPPKPTYDPQFVGTLGRGQSLRALVIWTPGQPPQSLSIGDDTPWGKLTSASASQLVFEGKEGQKTLSMF